MPLAATAAGVYWLGNGWMMTALEGDATAVAADGDGHAMAVVDGDLFVHADDDTEWGRRGVDRGGPPGRRGTGRARLRSPACRSRSPTLAPSVSTPVTAGGTRSLACGGRGRRTRGRGVTKYEVAPQFDL